MISPDAASRELLDLLTGENRNAVDSPADLIPARMLNEFAYCPRLAYLEWVGQEFTENLETLQGTFGHRNVDRPDRRAVPPGGEAGTTDLAAPLSGDQLAARSLELSAASEGLIAKLDLLELTGNNAVPIDYKRGAVPNNAEQSWEPDRVQLCAQGLILRANGYACDFGELYYIESRQRIRVQFDDRLVIRTRELVAELQALARSQQLPPPLVDSPKCPRCSLVGICLPDETNLLAATASAPPQDLEIDSSSDNTLIPRASNGESPPPRPLITRRHEALPLYVQEQGASVGKDGERIVVRLRESKPVLVPLIDVSQVSLFGNVQLSAQLLRELADRDIPICHLSYGGWFHALTTGHSKKNIELRIAQYAVAADRSRAATLAREFIAAKVRNCRTLLRRHCEKQHQSDLDQLADYLRKISRVETLESLLGLEGMSAKVYFAGFARLLRGGDEFRFDQRNRRPPTDPVNALLSFVYGQLVKELTIATRSAGLDPYLGFLHQPRHGRPSLALDLAEEFRPLIGDSVVLTLVNNEEVTARDFIRRAGGCALTDAGRRATLAAFERRMETEIKHPIFGYSLTYRRVLEVQARLLSRVLIGEIATYPGFCTR